MRHMYNVHSSGLKNKIALCQYGDYFEVCNVWLLCKLNDKINNCH